jgi:hypothetical protein
MYRSNDASRGGVSRRSADLRYQRLGGPNDFAAAPDYDYDPEGWCQYKSSSFLDIIA